MTVLVPVLGSGAALWSLSNEFWYYILFPCMVLVIARRRNSLRTLAYLGLLVAIFLLLSRTIAEYMSIWLLGVAVVRAPSIRLSQPVVPVMCTAAFIVFVAVTSVERTMFNVISLGGDCAIGAAFAVLLYCVRCRDAAEGPQAAAAIGSRRWARLAGFSYTLYLFHQPPLAFAGAWLTYRYHALWQPTGAHVAYTFAIAALVVFYAYLGSRLTEARTDELRDAIVAFFAKRRGVAERPRSRLSGINDPGARRVTA
jgi:peptidoglycan/LPS O-acetylase OafA/YrhL